MDHVHLPDPLHGGVRCLCGRPFWEHAWIVVGPGFLELPLHPVLLASGDSLHVRYRLDAEVDPADGSLWLTGAELLCQEVVRASVPDELLALDPELEHPPA